LTVKAKNKTTCLSPYTLHVENVNSEKHLTEHRVKSHKPLIRAGLNIPEKVKNSFLY